MKYQGFTLIELLVVVLIIGILAAIALPQYQKAVAKSKITQVVIASKALWQAEQEYFLANGKYTDDGKNLAISYPCINNDCSTIKIKEGATCSFYLSDTGSEGRVSCGIGPGHIISFQRYLESDKIMCCSYEENNYISDTFCKEQTGSSEGHNWCGTNTCKCYQNQ